MIITSLINDKDNHQRDLSINGLHGAKLLCMQIFCLCLHIGKHNY